MLDPEVEVLASPQLANAGQLPGPEGWRRVVGEWLSVWDDFAVRRPRSRPSASDHVLLQARQTGRGKGSGVAVEIEVCYMVELHDGLAKRYHLYPDREQALAAVREAGSG